MAIFRKKAGADIPRRRMVASQAMVRETRPQSNDQQTFRRNRTLTGTTSNHINNLAGSQADLQSPRAHVHHLSRLRRRIGSVFAVVVLAALFIYWLLTQLTAHVTVTFSDTSVSKNLNTSLYQKAIDDYMVINPFSRLRFVLDLGDLAAYMTQTLPEVHSITQAKMGNIGETTFSVQMRQPVAGWQINSKQYYVDASGVAFERNFYNNPSVQILDESGAALQQGTAIASNRFLRFVGRVVALSKARNYTITDAILPAGTTRQLEVRLAGIKPLVKLSIDRPAGEQVEDMARALTYLASQGQAPDYIDVRVSGKAIYR